MARDGFFAGLEVRHSRSAMAGTLLEGGQHFMCGCVTRIGLQEPLQQRNSALVAGFVQDFYFTSERGDIRRRNANRVVERHQCPTIVPLQSKAYSLQCPEPDVAWSFGQCRLERSLRLIIFLRADQRLDGRDGSGRVLSLREQRERQGESRDQFKTKHARTPAW